MTNEQYKKPDSRQPFRGLLTESLDLNQLLDLRVNRDDELSRCLETVCNRRNNLLVYGERGIGAGHMGLYDRYFVVTEIVDMRKIEERP